MRFKSWLGRIPPDEHLSIYSSTEKLTTALSSATEAQMVSAIRILRSRGDGTVLASIANIGAKVLLFNRGSHVAPPTGRIPTKNPGCTLKAWYDQ